MTNAVRRRLLPVNALVDLPVGEDALVTVGCYALPGPVAGHQVSLWMRTTVRFRETGVLDAIDQDPDAWFITYSTSPKDRHGFTFPLVLHHYEAALEAAEQFIQQVAEGQADPHNPAYLARWARWWSNEHPHAAHLPETPRRTQ